MLGPGPGSGGGLVWGSLGGWDLQAWTSFRGTGLEGVIGLASQEV